MHVSFECSASSLREGSSVREERLVSPKQESDRSLPQVSADCRSKSISIDEQFCDQLKPHAAETPNLSRTRYFWHRNISGSNRQVRKPTNNS
mmetsp:Transcript_13868/g.29147  ORF Transcript_13868/g.29147 Transcript_13868/m.29147 type:complete len:92 (+) Transcript_13868:224-499(+)